MALLFARLGLAFCCKQWFVCFIHACMRWVFGEFGTWFGMERLVREDLGGRRFCCSVEDGDEGEVIVGRTYGLSMN